MFTASISSPEVGIAVLLYITVNVYNSGHDHRIIKGSKWSARVNKMIVYWPAIHFFFLTLTEWLLLDFIPIIVT